MLSRNAPPPWDGERVTLYHGRSESAVSSVLSGIDLQHSRARLDFGRGFYTTTIPHQAVSWARKVTRGPRNSGRSAVIAFEMSLDDLAKLDTLAFVRGDFDAERFWSLVWRCRRDGSDHGRASIGGWYDLVVGPVAADWRYRTPSDGFEQLSFHTTAAVDLLNRSNPRRVE